MNIILDAHQTSIKWTLVLGLSQVGRPSHCLLQQTFLTFLKKKAGQ
jgi:hypothetical protein